MRRLLNLLLPLLFSSPLVAQRPEDPAEYLYRVVTLQASPGHLLELIDLHKEQMAHFVASGDEQPYFMRHSQGDRWDILIVYPMGSMAEYYAPDRLDRRSQNGGTELAGRIEAITGWNEELFASGPKLDVVDASFEGAGLFHVEMMVGLPGKRAELFEERRMENEYLDAIGRIRNLIFVREGGGAYDVFTIGFYRDLQHFAEPSSASDEEADAAARSAGFEGRGSLGTYLRTLLLYHHDTLAVAIP